MASPPSWYIGSNRDTGSWIASNANTTSSLGKLSSLAICETVGSLLFSFINLSLTNRAL